MTRASTFIDQQRLWDHHMAIARFGATGNGGVNRQALTPEDGQARAALAGWAGERGFRLIADEAGNLFVRREGTDPDAPAILSGSHLDTQPAGGNFDGIYGVLSAFEVLEALEDGGIEHRHPIEAVVWTNEEGCRFAPGCTGSLVFSGKHQIEEFLDFTAPDGAVLRDELERTLAATPGAERRQGGIPVAGYIETHIEQGPRLESAGLTVGAVTGIQGGSSFAVTVTGIDGHAGTVPLQARRDAFRSAHGIIDALYRDLADPSDTVRFTVGRFEAHPGSPNTIPGKVIFTIDFRHPDQAFFRAKVNGMAAFCAAHAGPCEVVVQERHAGDPADFDETVVARIERIAGELEIPAMRMPSGADHDAKYMVPLCPTGMIFVPCLSGISHNEDERADAQDLAAGARVLADALLEMARG
ncbi:MAG: M20 family metallo-hydrolase [Alphaproteobacteria bacterium]|jgi:beta-ureidopropionase / N-carbamoyl-L-amino-acid hydrolase|nr:M20 family metallo-hydrolase [Rhodospirillaceae bacterium]MBT6511371.1 M20 family metallo-hydrolase [Rhodospirillaceae bacterium]MDG2482353.1 M20 family metallo-hydrolase [Alphaproteobacteria bacterium]